MSNATARATWNALIRTHHITSRKKVTKLRQAASNEDVHALLRSGGCPGIMYVEGTQNGVENWVAAVQRLRYKDFQLACKPAAIGEEVQANHSEKSLPAGLFETETVKDFASKMENRGVLDWWRKAMGYKGSEDRLQSPSELGITDYLSRRAKQRPYDPNVYLELESSHKRFGRRVPFILMPFHILTSR